MRFTPVGRRGGAGGGTAALLAASALVVVLWLWTFFGGGGVRVLCGEFPTQGCLDQMSLFALASLLPAVLAIGLMVAAVAVPVMRRRAELRTRTLAYALIAWLIAGFTFVLGGLPAI